MTRNAFRRAAGIYALLVWLAWPSLAAAYIGPGLGLSAIGSLFAVLGALVMGVLGFIWYPMKKLIRWLRRPKDETE